MKNQIYIGTILLERNRWSLGKVPTYQVSDWMDRFARDGFDGVELWENHAALCSDDELARLERSPLPIVVFNSYAGLGDCAAPERERSAAWANRLRVGAVKFNVGNDPALSAEYARNAVAWANAMPQVTRLLCECHAGTLLEDLDAAQAMFDAWSDGRFQAIVHAFGGDEKPWVNSLRRLGPRIVTHIHAALGMHTPATLGTVQRQVAVLREMGFDGSITLEFTEGTGEIHEDKEIMYGRALRDLALLRKVVNA